MFLLLLPRCLGDLDGISRGGASIERCGLPRSGYSSLAQPGIGSIDRLGRPPKFCRTPRFYMVPVSTVMHTAHVDAMARISGEIHGPPPLFLVRLPEVRIAIGIILPLTLLNPCKWRPPNRRTGHSEPVHHRRACLWDI